MRAHAAFWEFVEVAGNPTWINFMEQRSKLSNPSDRAAAETYWLVHHCGRDARQKWSNLEKDQRKNLMAETPDPDFPAHNRSGIWDDRFRLHPSLSHRRHKRQRTQRLPPPPSTPSSSETESNEGTIVLDDDAEEPPSAGLPRRDADAMDVQFAVMTFALTSPLELVTSRIARACWDNAAKGHRLPSREDLLGSLLDKVYAQVQSKLVNDLRVKKVISLMVTTVQDDDGTQRLVFSVGAAEGFTAMWSSTRVAVDDAARPDDIARWIAMAITKTLHDIRSLLGDSANLVAVMADGVFPAAVNEATWQYMVGLTCHLVSSSSAARQIETPFRNTFSADDAVGGHFPALRELVTNAAALSKFFVKHQELSRMVCREQSNSWRLCTPNESIRSIQMGLRQLLSRRLAISAAATDQAMMVMCQGHQAAVLRAVAGNNAFWASIEALAAILDSLSECHSTFDRSDCVLSTVYKGLVDLRQQVFAVVGVPADIRREMHAWIDTTWRQIRSNGVAAVAFLLDMRYTLAEFRDDELDCAVGNANDFADELGILEDKSVSRQFFREAMQSFVSLKRNRTPSERAYDAMLSPMQWWSSNRFQPVVRCFALRVFAIPTTTSPARRMYERCRRSRESYGDLDDPITCKLEFVLANIGALSK